MMAIEGLPGRVHFLSLGAYYGVNVYCRYLERVYLIATARASDAEEGCFRPKNYGHALNGSLNGSTV